MNIFIIAMMQGSGMYSLTFLTKMNLHILLVLAGSRGYMIELWCPCMQVYICRSSVTKYRKTSVPLGRKVLFINLIIFY